MQMAAAAGRCLPELQQSKAAPKINEICILSCVVSASSDGSNVHAGLADEAADEGLHINLSCVSPASSDGSNVCAGLADEAADERLQLSSNDAHAGG